FLFTFLNLIIKLPTRQNLSETILNNAATYIQNKIIKKATEEEIIVTLSIDGWTNIKAQNLLGVVMITSVDHSRTEDIMKQIEEVYNDVRSNNIKIACIVTDSAAAYATA
ncbi:6495_t:CDS:2, partial [Scutellospora calospora]